MLQLSSAPGRPSLVLPLLAVVAAVAIFVVDTITPLDIAVAVLYVSDLEAHTLPRSEALRSLYALTSAEIELVELLCDGCSLEEAAEHRGVTMNTARSQLKQIFFKTNTSRQSELVRLVLAGIAPIRNP